MGQSGQFVWVVKDGKTAHMQPVKIGPAVNGITAISHGIALGDAVVTDGQIQLGEGSKVQIVDPSKIDSDSGNAGETRARGRKGREAGGTP